MSEAKRTVETTENAMETGAPKAYTGHVRIGLSLKSLLIDLAIFAGVLTLTVVVIFRQVSPEELISALESVKAEFIFAGLGMMAVYFCLQSVNIRRIVSVFGMKLSFPRTLKYALIGFFFSSVTPASTGGKPMQIFYMYRDGYDVSESMLSLIFEVMNFELVMAIYAVTGYISQHTLLVAGLGKVRFALLFGIGVNVLVVVLLMLGLFSEKAIHGFTKATLKVVSVFGRSRAEEAAEKVRSIATEYQKCSVYIRGNKPVIAKTFITELFQVFAFFSVPYFVYLGFGQSEYNIFQIMLLEAVAYVSLVFLPVPGAIGASEGVFVMIFRMIFPAGTVATAMVLSRSLSYYLIVIITGIVVVFARRRPPVIVMEPGVKMEETELDIDEPEMEADLEHLENEVKK